MNKQTKMKKEISLKKKYKSDKQDNALTRKKHGPQKKDNKMKKNVLRKGVSEARSEDIGETTNEETDEVRSEETNEATSEEIDESVSKPINEKSNEARSEETDESDSKSTSEKTGEEEKKHKKNLETEKAKNDPYLLNDAYYISRSKLWKNKQRVLLVRCPLKRKNCKSFIDNLKLLLPHNKVEGKWERKLCKAELNEISSSRNCNNIIFFDINRTRYCLWICKPNLGPSLYFEILDYIPLHSLIFPGNCLLYSRPLLLFSKSFDKLDHLKLIKEMFIHVFGIPNYHPLSKPFHDHCYHFFYADELIYFRHYQILPITLADSNNIHKQKLVEIGPRFTLHVIKIFNGCFSGDAIYENKKYKEFASSAKIKSVEKQKKRFKMFNKKIKRNQRTQRINYSMKSDMDL